MEEKTPLSSHAYIRFWQKQFQEWNRPKLKFFLQEQNYRIYSGINFLKQLLHGHPRATKN